jgi:hypothetical protein
VISRGCPSLNVKANSDAVITSGIGSLIAKVNLL